MIGAPSLDVAAEFCRHTHPDIRYIGADIVGSIGKQPSRSIALLLPLLDDPDASVRSQAYTAFAEFPGPDSESILIPRLRNDFSTDGAYSLHTCSTNALIALIDTCIASTSDKARASLLAALAANDEFQSGIKRNFLNRSSIFIKHLGEIAALMEKQSIDEQLPVIRSNIIASGRPHVTNSLFQSKLSD